MTMITIDGKFSDWTSAERIDNPANAVAGYTLYGTEKFQRLLHRHPSYCNDGSGDRSRHDALAQY